MDVVAHAGTTRAGAGLALVALSFGTPGAEQAWVLLHVVPGGKDAKTLEHEAAAIVEHSLLGSEGEPWQRLDGTLKELNGLFKGLVLSKTIEEAHAVIALLDKEDTLHVSTSGRGEAYLVRAGLASQITEYNRGKPMAAFVHISSGALEPGDIVLLSSQRLLRALTPAQLVQLTAQGRDALSEIISSLESEREPAAVAMVRVPGGKAAARETEEEQPRQRMPLSSQRRHQRGRMRGGDGWMDSLAGMGASLLAAVKTGAAKVSPVVSSVGKTMGKKSASLGRGTMPALGKAKSRMSSVPEKIQSFLADLRHPERKRRAHLLLLAGCVAVFIAVWLLVSLLTSSQRSKTRAELADLVTQINTEIRTSDNRRLAGDVDAANAILQRAEERAKQVMDNESGLFRVEALDLLDRIRAKREEINNIVRVSARVVVNLSSKNTDVEAQGLIGLGDGEFIVYDRQNGYRVLLNRLDDPRRIVDEELIIQGLAFPRYNAEVYLTTGNSVIEVANNQQTTMKTEDPSGWITGKDAETYLRYLYILSPERKQIYKYERLQNRYGVPAQYNVNGDLTGAIDMSIDGSVYVLKEGGTVIKLLRGEVQPFSIRHAPENVLADATKMFKVTDGKFFFLDPKRNRVIVASDGGLTGDSSYEKQYILEGDQVGTLQDLYVDPEGSRLYVIDEKRVYDIDLTSREQTTSAAGGGQ
jgi:hypothetical protein